MFRTRLQLQVTSISGALTVCTAAYLLLSNGTSKSTSNCKPVSAAHFTPAVITSSEASGLNTKLITLSIPPQLLPPRNSPSLTPIWSVFIKDDDIQVERPYTPLYLPDHEGRLIFWIKRYPHGEVGRWLHSKNVGDYIELRGPLKTWQWKEDVWDEVIMISGGTGITPFFQLVNNEIARCDSELSSSRKTKFTLLHSSLSPAELPPPIILEPLLSYSVSRPDRFKLHLYVDTIDGLNDNNSPQYELQVGRIGKTAIERSLGLDRMTGIQRCIQWILSTRETKSVAMTLKDRKILFLVCGPPPMIEAISGLYGRNLSQGVVGGVLGQMGFTSDQVWKL